MPWINCETCNAQAFVKGSRTSQCSDCESQSEPDLMSESDLREILVDQTIGQAKVLDKFGKVMQIIGYILIWISAFGLVISLFTEQWIVLAICLVNIPLIFAYFNVFGSAFRAIGLYIQVRVK
jgi:hypothetical protein